MMVLDLDEVFMIERDTVFRVHGRWFAIGAARDFALGALAAGATAEEAVRLAIAHTGVAAGRVETLTLGGPL